MKNKVILSLLALAAVSLNVHAAVSAPPAPLPEFMDQQELAKWNTGQGAIQTSVAKAPELATQFYTGKPYVADAGGYVFKYRTYNPEMSRWTSADPSGFPDGPNNQSYASNPTTSFDSLGLYTGTAYSVTYGGTTYTNTSDENKWVLGQAGFQAAGYTQASEAMDHADGATPGNWTLSTSDVNYIQSTSQYKNSNNYDNSTIYGDIENQLAGLASPGSSQSVDFTDNHVTIGDQYSNGYYAFGHVNIEVTGTLIDTSGTWSLTNGTVSLTKANWSFAGDGPPGVSPSSPTAVGYRLQSAGYLHAFSVSGTWQESWTE